MNNIIEKWKLNKSLLAKKMNMPLGTFCNKLSVKHDTQFSNTELLQLKMILKDLADDIYNEEGVDFNDALSVAVSTPAK